MLEQLLANADPAAITEGLIGFATRAGGALLFLIVAWIVAGWARRVAWRMLVDATDIDDTLGIFVSNAVRWAILTMALLAALGMFGIQTTSFAAVIGAAGLAIGALAVLDLKRQALTLPLRLEGSASLAIQVGEDDNTLFADGVHRVSTTKVFASRSRSG